MKGKWKLGVPFGIGVYLHWSVALLVLLFAMSGFAGFGFATGMLLLASLVGSVILHELGHSLAARHYGIGTRDIVLYAIGGVASLERMPKDPKQELVIALAGPMVNVVIAAVLFPLLSVMQFVSLGVAEFLVAVAVTNVALVIFNMVPAFPMDGGRVFRALMSMKKDRVEATNIAAKLGKVIAVLFILVGVFGNVNPMLAVIGMFVWFAGESERRMVAAEAAPNPWGTFSFGRFGPMFYQFRHSDGGSRQPEPRPEPAPSQPPPVRDAEWEVLPPERSYRFPS